MLPEMKTHGHDYHADLKLSDTPLEIGLGVVESARARYMDVIHDMD